MGGGITSASPFVLAVHRVVLRALGGPLRPVAARAYEMLARGVCAYVARGAGARATSYLRGSAAGGDFVPGLSDLDTVVVFSGPGAQESAARARSRWRGLAARVPAVGLLVDGPVVFVDEDLRRWAGLSAFTYGVSQPAPKAAAYFGPGADFDRLRTLERPGLRATGEGWRRLRGDERRPFGSGGSAEPIAAAWLELAYLWRWTFPACVEPGPRTAALCVSLTVEASRIWLQLARDLATAGQRQTLEAALRELPGEEAALQGALELRDRLHRSPEPALEQVLPLLVRMSERIAGLVVERVGGRSVAVRLTGHDPPRIAAPPGSASSATSGPPPAGGPLPLADWRSLVCPLLPDEMFSPEPGDPGSPVAIAMAARRAPDGPYIAFLSGEVMLKPSVPWWRSRMRSAHCRVTDPVSFALAEGASAAEFPEAAGFSAGDVAVRAVNEHRAWLRGEPGEWSIRESELGPGGRLAMLLSAARAGLFEESVREGDPELAVTVAAVGRRLAERDPAAAGVSEAAVEAHRAFAEGGRRPDRELITAVETLAGGLPAYKG